MTTPFPLLRLPRLAIIPVLQQMEFIEVIALSFLSNQAMRLSMFFRLKSQGIRLRLEANNIELMVRLTCGQVLVLHNYLGNCRVVWWIENEYIVWNNFGGLSAVECISRTIQVTHCDFIDHLAVLEMPQYNFFRLFPTLPTIREVFLSSDISDTLVLRALRIVLLKTSKLYWFPTNRLTSLKNFQEILIGNLDIIKISREQLPFTLDDLLMTNAVKIRLNKPTLNEKDLNRFFKLWMKNRCNPRLEYLAMWTENDFREDLLLKGLNAVQISDETTRTFRVSGYVKQRPSGKTINGGFDIKRRIDGTRGTIGIDKILGMVHIRFYVWT